MSHDPAPAGKFLAYVDFVKDELPNRFAKLRPIYEVDTNPWSEIIDGRLRFADDGLVFWWQPPPEVVEHTVWVVSLQPQPTYGTDSRHRDKYAVADAKKPYQGLILQDAAGPVTFRRVLASGHLSFEAPLVGRPLVKVPGEDHWILLPESIRTQERDNHYLVTVFGIEGVTPKYAMAAGQFHSVTLEGSEVSLSLDLGISHGFQCALSDVQLIEHMRRRVSAIDRGVLDSLEVTKNLLREYVAVLDTANIGGDEIEKEEVRRQAITALVGSYESDVGELEAIVAALMQYPPVKQGVESQLEIELEESRRARQREIEAEQSSASDSLALTRAKVEQTSRELQLLEDGVRAAVQEITNAPMEALARHGLLDAMKSSILSEWSPPQRTSELEAQGANGRVSSIVAPEELTKAAVGWAASVVVDPYMMQVALATILAHRVSLVLGPSADRLATAVAKVIAGDRSVRVSISTTTFGVSDLLNSPVSPLAATRTERIACLGDFLSACSEDECTVVVLSGCNRAPLEVILPEFLLTYGDDVNILGWKRDDGRYEQLTLPRGLKVIGTLYGGDVTYKVPAEFSNQLGVVPSDHEEISGVRLGLQPSPPLTRISGSLCEHLAALPESYDLSNLVNWLQVSGVALAGTELATVFSVYLKLIRDPERAVSEAIAAMVLGRASESKVMDWPEKEYEKVFDRLKELSQAPAWQRVTGFFGVEGDE